MRLFLQIVLLLLPLPYLLPAQSWEVGASGGYGLYRDAKVTNGTISGTVGFSSGLAFGGVFANDMHRLVGGEARYTFRSNDLRVSSGALTAKMSGQSHALHYDVLVHGASKESSVRPFAALGAGVKLYRGTG